MKVICEYCGKEIKIINNCTDKVKKSVCMDCLKSRKEANDWAKNLINKTLFGSFKEGK